MEGTNLEEDRDSDGDAGITAADDYDFNAMPIHEIFRLFGEQKRGRVPGGVEQLLLGHGHGQRTRYSRVDEV